MGGIAQGLGRIVGDIAGGFMGGAGLTGQGSNIDYSGLQGRQSEFQKYLMDQMKGQGVNLAELQMKAAQDRATQQMAGSLAGARGVNSSLAARLAAEQGMGLQANVAQQSGIARANQQLAAQQQYAASLGQEANLLGAQQQQQQQQQQSRQQMIGSLMNVAGTAAAQMFAPAAKSTKTASPTDQFSITQLPASTGSDFMVAAEGGRIPGSAPIDGDSYDNDIVPAMLSPGEIVIPRSHAKDTESAKAFVEHLMRKEKSSKKLKND